MELSHFRLIIAIAECGSITAASKKLYITPVSLMQQLNQLEAELQYPVFNRSHTGCTLTPAGEKLYSGGQKILAEVNTLITESAAASSMPEQVIHMSVYAPYTLIELSEEYRKTHPAVSFHYEYWTVPPIDDISSWMSENHLDLVQNGYRSGLEERGLHFQPLIKDRYCCFFHPSLPISQKNAVTLKDLAGYRVLSFSQPSEVVDRIEEECREEGICLERVPYSESNVLAAYSNYSVFILDGVVSQILKNLNCRPLEPEHVCLHGIIYPSQIRPPVRDFLRYLENKTIEL